MKIKHIFVSMALVTLCLSCTKSFEDMNKNWKNPTGTEIGPLFNGVIRSLQLGWNEQFWCPYF